MAEDFFSAYPVISLSHRVIVLGKFNKISMFHYQWLFVYKDWTADMSDNWSAVRWQMNHRQVVKYSPNTIYFKCLALKYWVSVSELNLFGIRLLTFRCFFYLFKVTIQSMVFIYLYEIKNRCPLNSSSQANGRVMIFWKKG